MNRYGYAGAWGYEQLSELHEGVSANAPSATWLHVGHRTYDPATGRFLERDPIGILGGLNVYEYVGNAPTIGLDPQGLRDGFSDSDWGNLVAPPGGWKDYRPYSPKKYPSKPATPGRGSGGSLTGSVRGAAFSFCYQVLYVRVESGYEMIEVGGIYWAMGGIGATVGEGSMLLFGTPLYSDYKPGTIYKKLYEGWKDQVWPHIKPSWL